jgi:hypothetical protein
MNGWPKGELGHGLIVDDEELPRPDGIPAAAFPHDQCPTRERFSKGMTLHGPRHIRVALVTKMKSLLTFRRAMNLGMEL